MDAIIEVGNYSQVFRMLRSYRIFYHGSLHFTDAAMIIQSLSGIHQVQVKQRWTFFVDVRSRQIQDVLAFCLLPP